MYSKFNYSPSSKDLYNSEINRYKAQGNELYEHFKEQSHIQLSKFIIDNGTIDGTTLQKHWFEIQNADVFLSHSHNDLNKVKSFAGWLYEKFGLTSFIDSCAWGYCDDLLKVIDDKYCKNKSSNTYNYNLRNYTTSHVHIMLSAALTEMIDKTECIIFVNTPNSIKMSNELSNISNKNYKLTLSPWLYHELSMSSMMRITPPKRNILLEHNDTRNSSYINSQIKIGYDINKQLNSMVSLTEETLRLWAKEHNSNKNALDELYDLLSIN